MYEILSRLLVLLFIILYGRESREIANVRMYE
jgi:hypothetical protein